MATFKRILEFLTLQAKIMKYSRQLWIFCKIFHPKLVHTRGEHFFEFKCLWLIYLWRQCRHDMKIYTNVTLYIVDFIDSMHCPIKEAFSVGCLMTVANVSPLHVDYEFFLFTFINIFSAIHNCFCANVREWKKWDTLDGCANCCFFFMHFIWNVNWGLRSPLL